MSAVRVLVEGEDVRHDVAAEVLGGTVKRSRPVQHRDRLVLVPAFDLSSVYYITDVRDDETVGVLNVDAVPSATALVDRLDQYRDRRVDA